MSGKKGKSGQFGKYREQSSVWKGGETIKSGYVFTYCPEHPYAQSNGYIKRARLIMEAHIGRVLLPTEAVHHINGIKNDDRIENLMLFSSRSKHSIHHFPKGKTWNKKKGIK